MAATTGTPAIAAFWISSNEARPESRSTEPVAGMRPFSRAQPSTLSTALCRLTSSRITCSSPAAPKSPAPCGPRRPCNDAVLAADIGACLEGELL